MQTHPKLKQLYFKFRAQGVMGLLEAASRRIIPRRAACFVQFKLTFADATGLELGGPSAAFSSRGFLPVYDCAGRIDNCNFGHETLWEGSIEEGETFEFDKTGRRGNQFVAEATDLRRVPSTSYDFVLSSNTLEHIANPLQALVEWIRVLKEGGLLALILPHRDATFDHRRPVTTLDHLIQDFEQKMDESDLTHLDEILALHDLNRDSAAGDFENFKARSLRNLENRSLHHHVFDTRLAIDVVDHMGLEILAVEAFRPYDILVLARKNSGATNGLNARFKANDSARAWRSPFVSDRTQ